MKENWEIHWKDYYKILQVHQLAEPESIKIMYKKLLDRYHPDHNPGKERWATEKSQEIIEAYEILGNPAKRTVYDTKYNQKDFIPIPPKPEVKANANGTYDDTSQSRWQNVTQLIYCPSPQCKRKTNMLIAFVNERPAYGTCPICHKFRNLKAYFESQPKHTNPHPKTRPYPDWDE